MKFSRQKNNKRIATASALLLAVVLASTACGAKDSDPNQPVASPPSQVDKLPEGSGIVEPGVAGSDTNSDNSDSNNQKEPSNNGDNNNKGESAGAEVVKGEGEFAGIADSHSIEIKTDSGYLVFQYKEELSEAINKLESDAKVSFSYTVQKLDDGSGLEQNWLVSIEPK